MTIKVGNFNIKGEVNNLSGMPRVDIDSLSLVSQTGIYCYRYDGMDYDFIFFRRDDSCRKKLYVFLSGAVDRGKVQMPAFRRWSWNGLVPSHCMFFSDPTLKQCDTLGLGWFIGTPTSDVIEVVVKIALECARMLGLKASDIVFYGSSGGGFAALRAVTYLREASAIVINPQTKLSLFFDGRPLSRYLDTFWGGMSVKEFTNRYRNRNSMWSQNEALARSRIVYVQNTIDEQHVKFHVPQMFRIQNDTYVPIALNNYLFVSFFDPGGHVVSEPQSMLNFLLDSVDDPSMIGCVNWGGRA